MSKWRKVYWNDVKRFVAEYGIPIVLVLGIGILGSLANNMARGYKKQVQTLQEANRCLEDEQLELLKTTTLMGEEIDRLSYENDVFGSMLAEIENEPGGHELLKKLYDQER